MEKHNKLIAPNAKVAMIHMSLDDDLAEATALASKEGFPWLTVFQDDAEASGLKDYGSGFVPDYVLIDKEGKVVTKGKEEVFTKIAALK